MFRNIFNTFGNCFKNPKLNSCILFTFGMLAVARLIVWICIPGFDGNSLHTYFAVHSQNGGMLEMYNTFSGGALEHCAIGTLGFMPYIIAAIIAQLLAATWQKLNKH